MSEKLVNRRSIITSSLLGAGALLSVSGKASDTLKSFCGLTPAQTEGPFYPISDQADKDWDLTVIKGNTKKASGEVILIKGVVQDQDCKPVPGALVEIWQACESGKYNHPGDPNTATLDPTSQYWGRAISNQRGEYLFKTIKPGHYPATSTWMRPAHIHVKVHLRGFEELTTQLYFKGDRYNAGDRILQRLSASERKLLLVDLKEDLLVDPKLRVGVFDINLRPVV